jgi:hypothetical protein
MDWIVEVMPRGAEAPVGTERISANGYLYRKTENDGWQLIHRLVAEEKLGRKLLENEYASFIDGDKTNLEPDNIVVRLRGRSSLRRRLAQVEARLSELNAARDDLVERLEVQDQLASKG